MIRIKSKRHLFRRCGIAHPAEAVEYPDNRFTPAELAILKAEGMLVVEIIPEKPAATPVAEPGTDFKSVPQVEVKAAETGKEPVKSGKKGKK